VDEVLQMAAELRELEPGWSAGEQCQLNRCEQLWLDPERGKTDAEFAKDYALGAWRDELCERFSLWLNRQLQTKGKTFGADEARSWSGLLEAELKLLREDMSDD
jgi:CRISPR-associated protein Csy1